MKFDDDLPDPVAPEQRQFSESTAVDYGDRLPLGVYRDGVLHREFAFRPYKSSIEKELDKLKQKNQAMNNVEWATVLLATMLTRLGPYTDFAEEDFNTRRAIISRLYQPDMLYLIVRLRQSALGSEVRFNLTCPRCAEKYRPSIDLDDLKLTVAETAQSLTTLHTLRDGIVVGGKTYTKLVLGPPRWGALAGIRSRSTVDAEFAIIVASIRRALTDAGEVSQITSDMLGESSKYDFEVLKKVIDDEMAGPDLALQSECPSCGFVQNYGVDWSWDFFFKAASL